MSEETLDLDAVATASMSEAGPQETTTTSEPTTTAVTPEKVEKTVTQSQESQQQKLSRRQQAAKEAAEYRSKAEQERISWAREKAELQKKLQQVEPILPFVSEFQKALEQKKQEELAKRYQENPQAVSDERTQEMIQQALMPYQQQADLAQRQQFANESLSKLRSWAGGDQGYNELSPYLKQVLDNTTQLDPNAGDLLAKYPEALFRIARDMQNEQKQQAMGQQQQIEQVKNQESKAEMAKFNGGVSRPNRFAKAPTVQGREAAKNNAYDFIREITGNK